MSPRKTRWWSRGHICKRVGRSISSLSTEEQQQTWEEMDGEVLEPALVSVSGAVALFEIFDVVSGFTIKCL